MYGGWSGGTPDDCGFTTILKSSGGALSVTHTMGSHYGMRVLVSGWWLAAGSDITMTVNLPTTPKTGTLAYPSPDPRVGDTNSPYCAGSRAVNYDSGVFSGESTSSVTVSFTSGSTSWGIR